MTNRRNFLKQSLASALSATPLGVTSLGISGAYMQHAHAAITPNGNDYKSLVIINLNGGNDSLSMLIPNTQSEYNLYSAPRSTIAYDKSDLLPITPAGMANNSFALNPRMSDMQDLFNDGDLSFVANVGSLTQPITKQQFLNDTSLRPEGLGGHDTQTSYWQGDNSGRIDTSKDGWGGRLANEFIINATLPTNIAIKSPNAVFQRHATELYYNVGLSGLTTVEDFVLGRTADGVNARKTAINALNQLAQTSNDPFTQHAGELFETGLDLNVALQAELANVPDLSDNFLQTSAAAAGANLAAGLARIAELISIREQLNMRRQIFFVQLPGFDTHFNHNEIHGNNSQDLSTFMKAFNEQMKLQGTHDSVLTMTTSEFGRNLASNGDGVDHAWGAQHMVMGGPVDGGKIFGTFPSLELDSDDDYNGSGRMIPTLSVTQYGATAAKWFGVPSASMANVFPNISNFATPDIGYIA